MAARSSIGKYPANALIAAYVLDALAAGGVLRRTDIAGALERMAERVPPHWLADQRMASLTALRTLLEDPGARSELPFARRD